jgi:hypothetical protein
VDANIRRKNAQWDISERTASNAALGVLMDIRDELQTLVALQHRLLAVLECGNTATIPHTLKRIDRRLAQKFPLNKG